MKSRMNSRQMTSRAADISAAARMIEDHTVVRVESASYTRIGSSGTDRMLDPLMEKENIDIISRLVIPERPRGVEWSCDAFMRRAKCGVPASVQLCQQTLGARLARTELLLTDLDHQSR